MPNLAILLSAVLVLSCGQTDTSRINAILTRDYRQRDRVSKYKRWAGVDRIFLQYNVGRRCMVDK